MTMTRSEAMLWQSRDHRWFAAARARDYEAPRGSLRLALLTAAVASCLLARFAHADDQTPAGERSANQSAAMKGEIYVVFASEAEGTIDPNLAHIRALKHPPFNGFKTMKLLTHQDVALLTDEPVAIELPKRRWLVLTLVSRLADGRAKVQLSINKPNQKDYLPLLNVIISAGEPFFVAGQKFEGGTLVVGVRVGERPKRAP
jgi:hypothetical protein